MTRPESDNLGAAAWPPVSLHGGHTRAADGAASVDEMVSAAGAVGMEVFGLSEHFYRPRDRRLAYPDEPASKDYGRADWPAFVEAVLERRERPREGDPERLLLGAEVEFLTGGYLDWTLEELARWPLDYTVLSVHFVELDGQIAPFDVSPSHFARAVELFGGLGGLGRRYYEHVVEALGWEGVGDVFGHLDVVKVYADGAVGGSEVDDLIDEALGLCARRGVVLDLNARGLIKPCAEVYPSMPILRKARAAGVRLITGDDSHRPSDVGLNLHRAAAWALEAGYSTVHLPPRLGDRSWDLSPSPPSPGGPAAG